MQNNKKRDSRSGNALINESGMYKKCALWDHSPLSLFVLRYKYDRSNILFPGRSTKKRKGGNSLKNDKKYYERDYQCNEKYV